MLLARNEQGLAHAMVPKIRQRCIEYFTRLYTKLRIESSFKPWFPRVVTTSMNIWLARLPTKGKVKGVVDKISANRAPGPDGFSI